MYKSASNFLKRQSLPRTVAPCHGCRSRRKRKHVKAPIVRIENAVQLLEKEFKEFFPPAK